jgi:large subunit ribosomal protein L3
LARRSERGHVARLDSKRSKRLSMGGVEPPAKANCEPKRFIREFRSAAGDLAIGQQLTVTLFEKVVAVDVTGTSKGRGTSGVMRRHHFSGQRASHGVKKVHRHGGSSGMNTFPARVFKGKRMAGRLGNERVTARNLKVVKIDADQNLLLVRGAVPGPNGGYLIIKQTNKV